MIEEKVVWGIIVDFLLLFVVVFVYVSTERAKTLAMRDASCVQVYNCTTKIKDFLSMASVKFHTRSS